MKNRIKVCLLFFFSTLMLFISGCIKKSTEPDLLPPIVSTSDLSQITATSLQGGGNVSKDGGATVTQRGVCWSTSQNPSVSNNHTIDGSGIGSFISNVTGLQVGTSYYLRAYAINSAGISYGSEIRFFIPPIIINTPYVTTTAISNIMQTSATSGGSVTSDGGATVTQRGICWSASQNPSITNNHTNDGTGAGSFTSNITGLTANTTYYLKAYAINSAGTSYGSVVNFTTPVNIFTPTVITTNVSNIAQTFATSGGNVTTSGGAPVTARGVCCGTSPNPTIQNSFTSDGTGLYSFTSNITGLSAHTLYYLRAYATNSVGTGYGNDISFTTYANIVTCGTVTDADGNNYSTVLIGTQCWMSENLKTTKYSDGLNIPNVTNNSSWYNLSTGAYCDYDNIPSNSNIYGRLYNWYAVSNGHNLCPANWHVPSEAEWKILEKFLDFTIDTTMSGMLGTDIGNKLREVGVSHWNSPNTGATNSSGFTALPSGYRDLIGSYHELGMYGYWWLPNSVNTSALIRYLNNNSNWIGGNSSDKSIGYSVRCVKD